jgi:formylglycine-generating enzyme required for sulfatase activity
LSRSAYLGKQSGGRQEVRELPVDAAIVSDGGAQYCQKSSNFWPPPVVTRVGARQNGGCCCPSLLGAYRTAQQGKPHSTPRGSKMFGKAFVSGLLAVALAATAAPADTFGTGENEFTMSFVPISGAKNPTNTSVSGGYGIVDHNYRIGAYEVTNEQWNKFTASLGVPVTGADGGYSHSFYDWGTGTINVPTNYVSWFEGAQFVNWLNTSTGHLPAYKFTGTQGTSDYTFAVWNASDAGYDAANPFRNKAAKYYLPTESEWVKAAYWNGTTLQNYATRAGQSVSQGHGQNATGWNFYDEINNQWATYPFGPWNVGSGSKELNGTYDMMGNLWEWMESPFTNGDYSATSSRALRGGSFGNYASSMSVSDRHSSSPASDDEYGMGLRVASVPEPGTIGLLVCGAITGLLWWRRSVRTRYADA